MARHKQGQRMAQQGEHIELTGFFAQMLGSWYPKGCVVAVIDDAGDAQAAAVDFRAAGFGENDVRVVAGDEVLRVDEQIRSQMNPVRRMVMRATGGTDEGMAMQQYLDAARAGHTIVIVRVGQRGTPDPRIRPIMEARGAHTIRVYQDFTIAQVGPA